MCRLNTIVTSWLNEVVRSDWNVESFFPVQIEEPKAEFVGPVLVRIPSLKHRNNRLAGRTHGS
jgi:hypothetical protein